MHRLLTLGCAVILACATSIASAADSVAIVVNSGLQPFIKDRLDRLVADLHADGSSVTVKPWDLTQGGQQQASDLKAWLAGRAGLDGAILIGDLPVAIHHHPEDEWDTTFACDLYFMDLDQAWPASGGKYLEPSGSIAPRIWVSRIKAGGMGGAIKDEAGKGLSETALVNRYLDKNHRFRTGALRMPDKALMWSDNDWQWRAQYGFGTKAYADLTTVRKYDGIATTRSDWVGRWSTPYETEFFMCHSSATSHALSGGGMKPSDIAAGDPKRLFWNCWNCSSGDYTKGTYIAGVRIFTPTNGLIAVATTKTGSMLHSAYFYDALGEGQSHGQAFRSWSPNRFDAAGSASWHRGMVILGDGTLRLGRFQPKIGETVAAPAILTAPAGIAVAAGETATFSVVASGTPTPAIRWQRKSPGATAFSDIGGATGASYALAAALADDGAQFRAIASNSAGNAISAAAVLTVRPATNTRPTIGAIAAVRVDEDTAAGPSAFTVADAETAAGSLTVSAASSNPTLVPSGGIVLGGSGGSRTVRVTPAANRNGTATITVTVSDGSLASSTAFTVTVTAVDDAPVNTVLPAVAGTARVGATLTADPGTWNDGADGGSIAGYAYQWQRADDARGVDPVAISGATASTYLLTDADLGKVVRVRVVATDQGAPASSATAMSAWSAEVTAAGGGSTAFSAKINFQPAQAPVPGDGYVADTGAVFAARHGLTYGWNLDLTAATRDRNDARAADQRVDTLIHLRQAGRIGVWEIAVPNGDYTVSAVCGDPAYTDSIHRLEVEGVLVVSGTPSGANRWIVGSDVVTVSDGRLTVRAGAGGANVKLCHIVISATPKAVN